MTINVTIFHDVMCDKTTNKKFLKKKRVVGKNNGRISSW